MPKTKKRLEKLFRLGVIMAIWGGALGVLMLAWVAWDLPDVTEVKPLNIRPGITILAADDTVITRTGGMKGKTVTLQDLPPYVAHAVLAIEDRRFYDHFGLDLRGLARAMFENVKAGRREAPPSPSSWPRTSSSPPIKLYAVKGRKRSWHCLWKGSLQRIPFWRRI